jgi:hypothetical protein
LDICHVSGSPDARAGDGARRDALMARLA